MSRKPIFRQVVGKSQPGYVYLIHAVGTNKFKIGKTCTPVSYRINDLQTGCPIRLRYVYHAYVENMNQTERELHYRFSDFRSIGEWFTLSHSDVKECITLMRLVQTTPSLSLSREVKIMVATEDEDAGAITGTSNFEPSFLDKALYTQVCEARDFGKSRTWIVENILNKKGRKFGEGKAKLQELLNQFEGE